MTKKDYARFAEMFAYQVAYANDDTYGVLITMIQETADIFKEDNPRFDYDRFYAACGVVFDRKSA